MSFVQPIVKMTFIGPSAKGTSKSKRLSSLNKSKTVAASKKKEKVVRSSLPENIASVVSHETTQGKPLTDGNTNPSADSSDNMARRKSDRRRSYTSLLMARSKVGVCCILVMLFVIPILSTCLKLASFCSL